MVDQIEQISVFLPKMSQENGMGDAQRNSVRS